MEFYVTINDDDIPDDDLDGLSVDLAIAIATTVGIFVGDGNVTVNHASKDPQ